MSSQQASESAPAKAILHRLGIGHWISQSLYVAAHLGIADALVAGPKCIDELACEVGASPQALYRILRALASVGVFTETKPLHFSLNDVATLLRNDIPGSMRSLALMTPLEWHPWQYLLHSVQTGETATQHLYGKNFFQHLQERPEQMAIFSSAMSSYVSQNAEDVCATYDFSGHSCVVDVGGGFGHLITAILSCTPGTNGVLFDLPEVVERSSELIAAKGLSERCSCVAGDFFQAVPEGADLYILSSVLHDWNDQQAIEILRRCRQASSPLTRVLLVEMVIPEGDEEFIGKWMDLEMLVMFGGRERTREDYAVLLESADFKLEQVTRTAGPVSLLEAMPI